MDAIFMNSNNSGTSDPYILCRNLMLLYQTLAFTTHGKHKKTIQK